MLQGLTAAASTLAAVSCYMLISVHCMHLLLQNLIAAHGGVMLITCHCMHLLLQNLIAAHGGVKSLLTALHTHRNNPALLPFAFDVLASLIVGNERNGALRCFA